MPHEVEGDTENLRRDVAEGLSELLRQLARCPDSSPGDGWECALAPGARIGRFELVREIGRGGFGIVYEARDRELGRSVAFKAVMPGRLAPRERLLSEAEVAARLSHPNFVTLFDVGRSPYGPYLVFELLRGMTLSRQLQQRRMTLEEALRVAVEVAKGIAHAHAHGVVHRDLKPGNVFLCDDGRVKVLDLGLAQAFGRRTVHGGTSGYMAPEQRRGAPEDERTDVFGLGVLLYRMLTGELPVVEADATRTSTAPALNVPGAPGLSELIARMLEPDPVQRPRDAGEVLAALAPFQAEQERSPSSEMASVGRRRRTWPGPRWAAAAAVIAVVAGLGLAARWQRSAGAASGPSIAVLPFADLSPDKDQEYFSDGLAEEILNSLASAGGLRVPSRTSSFYFKGTNARLADIGKELNVSAVLEGSVRRSGNRIRIAAEVVSVADGSRLWGASYDRELTDIFAVQDEISAAVVRAVGATLRPGSQPSSRGHATDHPEAYREYLIGREHYHRFTAASYRLSTEAYERAVALDPGYAPAWAGLAIALLDETELAESPTALESLRRRALAASEKAVALSPDLAEALSARGHLRARLRYDWDGARADLERAIALNPGDSDAHRRYEFLLEDLGRLPEALAEAQKAVDLDPLGIAWTRLGWHYQATGELKLADAAFRRQLTISPDSLPALSHLARNLLLQSKPKEAMAIFERCPEDDRLWGTVLAEHALGHPEASRAALAALISRYGYRTPYDIGEAYAWLGEKDAAFEWLARAADERATGMSGLFRLDPFLRNLRKDPRYTALLRQMKLPMDGAENPVR